MDARTLMLIGAGLVGLALPLLVYAFSSGPDATRRRALENLARESRAGAAATSAPPMADPAISSTVSRSMTGKAPPAPPPAAAAA